jgi:hypothetical protein
MTTIRLLHEGTARTESALVSCLRDEGFFVRYSPVIERRSGVDVAQMIAIGVSINLATMAATAALKKAVDKFHERFPAVNVANTEPEEDAE